MTKVTRKPVIRISLKTREELSLESTQGENINVEGFIPLCCLWQGEQFISGSFSNGWCLSSEPSYQVLGFTTKDGFFETSNLWLNGHLEKDVLESGVNTYRTEEELANFLEYQKDMGRLWCKTKDGATNHSLLRFDVSLFREALRLSNAQFDPSVVSIRYGIKAPEQVSKDSERQVVDLPVSSVYVNGYVNLENPLTLDGSMGTDVGIPMDQVDQIPF